MPLPTLLLKGNLVADEHSPSQAILDDNLPLEYIMKYFDDRIPQKYGEGSKIKSSSPADRILILKSSTGSGKSTLIPPKLFHMFFNRTKKNIACTQPRTLTAIEIPRNTIPPFNTKEQLTKTGFPNYEPLIYGKNIGTQTGVFTKKPTKGIIFMTPGIIVQQMNVMSNEEFMKKYSIIIIDEAHERSLQIDTVLYMLKKFISNNYMNKECPFLVVMSATFDTTKFCDYLLSQVKKPDRYKNIINVRGFTYPIEERFLQYDSSNFIQSAIDIVIDIHTNNSQDFMSNTKKVYKLKSDIKEVDQKFRDVLIFVKGPSEIVKLKQKLNKLNLSNPFFKENPILALGLTGDLVANQSIEYRNTVEMDIKDLTVEIVDGKKTTKKKPTRRIICATNVAETGITIETLKYVIEPGWTYSKEFNPCYAINLLVAKPVTQSMYLQRRGRVGRKAPGICYPVYTKKTFELMQENQYADIIKDDITLDLLSILIREVDPLNKVNELDIFDLFKRKSNDKLTDFEKQINEKSIDIFNIDLLDLPSADSLHYSLEKLYILGAINSNSIPTSIGFIINKFRFIKIESIKMILSGYAWDAPIEDLITIASFLESSLDEIFPDEELYKKALSMGKFTLFQNEQKKIISYSEYKSDLYINDDFIRYVLIFNEFQKKLLEIKWFDKNNNDNNKNIIELLDDWSNEYGISIKNLLNVIEIRESIINTLSIIGLNSFANNDKCYNSIVDTYSESNKLDYIKILKQCIFEGYKTNIAMWNPTDKKYYGRKSHLSINIESDYVLSKVDIAKYGDTNPVFILYDSIIYMLNSKTNLYESSVDHISVLDGYISIDPTFDSLL